MTEKSKWFTIAKPEHPKENYTIIPNSLIENDMLFTLSGNEYKLLLYILRNNYKQYNKQQIAKALGMNKQNLDKEFKKLVNKRILILDHSNYNLNFNIDISDQKIDKVERQISKIKSYQNRKVSEVKNTSGEVKNTSVDSDEINNRSKKYFAGEVKNTSVAKPANPQQDLANDQFVLSNKTIYNKTNITNPIENINKEKNSITKDNISLIVQGEKNDLKLILENNEHFRQAYEINTTQETEFHKQGVWVGLDITNHSNGFIAFNVFNYKTKIEKEQTQALKEDPTLSLQVFLTKFSKSVPNSQLWKEFKHLCESNDRLDLI